MSPSRRRSEAIERDSVHFGDRTIEYEVRRSRRRRKTVQITVDAAGVSVAAPARTPYSELRAIVQKRARWILRHVADAMLEPAPLRFISGERLPYLGRNLRMTVVAAAVPRPEVRFDHWRFRVAVPYGLEGDGRQEAIRCAFVRWYWARAAERLDASVDRWWPRLGRGTRSRVLIRDQRRRWGSCSFEGTLRFNWRVMMLAPNLIDYIVAHELAHLTHRNHSSDFWDLVVMAMPDAQQRRKRLREAGRTLPL